MEVALKHLNLMKHLRQEQVIELYRMLVLLYVLQSQKDQVTEFHQDQFAHEQSGIVDILKDIPLFSHFP